VYQDEALEATNELPPGMPEPLGLPVEITCFVDADHAGNLLIVPYWSAYFPQQSSNCLVFTATKYGIEFNLSK